MSDEVCRIGIALTDKGTVDVGAPMKYKEICFEMLKAARAVIARTADQHFAVAQKSFAVVMGQSGSIDVSAPLPPRELAMLMLDRAKEVIERFNDDKAPEMRAFTDKVMG